MGKKSGLADKSAIELRKPKKIGQKGNHSLLTADRIEIVERRYEVVQLRRDGYTIHQISQVLGVTHAVVTKDLRDSLNLTITEHNLTTDQERQIAIERLDNLIRSITPLATEVIHEKVIDGRSGKEIIVTNPPNPAYGALLLQAETRRAKLLALDVPEIKKLEVTGIREYIGINIDEV